MNGFTVAGQRCQFVLNLFFTMLEKWLWKPVFLRIMVFSDYAVGDFLFANNLFFTTVSHTCLLNDFKWKSINQVVKKSFAVDAVAI